MARGSFNGYWCRFPRRYSRGKDWRKEEHALTIKNHWPPYQLTPSTQDDTCPLATNTVATLHTIHPTYLTNLKYSLSDPYNLCAVPSPKPTNQTGYQMPQRPGITRPDPTSLRTIRPWPTAMPPRINDERLSTRAHE